MTERVIKGWSWRGTKWEVEG